MDEILKQFPDLTPNQIRQFSMLEELYKDWNSKINVISRKDIDELYTRHVLHSLAIAKVQPFAKGASILDVGTGGGFPGIPLAILFPETHFYLIDVIAKKRSEEHTSELQSRPHLVCRLLLEKKKSRLYINLP